MKTPLEKLLTSPDDKGFMGSPFIFFAIGGAFMVYALLGLFSGEIDVGRYSSRVVRYAASPRLFLFAVLTFFGLGAGLVWWGRRRLRLHED